MKFTIKKDEFLKALLVANKVIGGKIVNPVYVNYKIELDERGLVITSSNSEMCITTVVPFYKDNLEVIRDVIPGGTLINAKTLTEIIKLSNDDEITVEDLGDNEIKAYSKHSHYNLHSIRIEEYPDIDFNLNGTELEMTSKDFVDAVSQVAFSASTKDTKPLLTAINVEGASETITFTATDGSRLAKSTLQVDVQQRFNVNIPAKAMVEVARTITNEKEIYLYVSEKKVIFKLDNVLISSNLIVGDYPRTNNIVPKVFSYTLEVNSQEFLSAMNRVSIFSTERENIIHLSMSENKVRVSSRSQQLGSGEESISLFKFNGDDFEMSFNCEYVANAIRALRSEDVVLSFVGEMKPFTVSTKGNKNVIQVVTPVRAYY